MIQSYNKNNDSDCCFFRKNLPIIRALIAVYKLWQDFLPRLVKVKRYTLGFKIDSLFLETIEAIVSTASMPKEEKISYLNRAIEKTDLLKFFLYLAWEIKAIDTKKYILLSEKLDEIGRMLGGWKKQTTK